MNDYQLNLISLILSILNYQENINQSQLQEVIDSQTSEVHSHLQSQDEKIDKILEILKERGEDINGS